MQKPLDRETTIQAIRTCESSGLTGTAHALRNILDELTKTIPIAAETQSNDVTANQ